MNDYMNQKMFDEEEQEEEGCLPISRRSLVDRYQHHNISSDYEISPSNRRQSCLSLNNSFSADESIPTPKQLISLYEKTIELAAKNQINIKNAFHIPLVDRLPEVLDLVAFNDKLHSDPNFLKVGSIIDTSAKIYGLRVDALHSETQKFSGSIQHQEDQPCLPSTKSIKKSVQYYKSKCNSYIVSDLSTISIPYQLKFHPLQPSSICPWPGGIGSDSIYSDMVSYTMYSSSDYPLFNSFIDLNSRINMEYVDGENILDRTTKTIYDLIPLREVIKENEGENHVLGCQLLREFSFNEESTESYIETIDECSIIDSLTEENNQHMISDLRDEPTSLYMQELQSTYTCPLTMPSVDTTFLPNRMSFVDHVPYLLCEKTKPSDYTYFDVTKLKLFAGPYIWKYINLLPNSMKTSSIITQRHSHQTIRHLKINFSDRSINEILSINSHSKFIKKKRKQTKYSSISHSNHQLRLTRKSCSLNELIISNNISDLFWNKSFNHFDEYSFDNDDMSNYLNEQIFEYDFIRPIHYDKIEFDYNLTKINTKKLQYELSNEYQNQSLKSSSTPIQFSNICFNLMEKNFLNMNKSELITAFYCMLNNCNKKHLFMKNNSQYDDLIIQTQPFYYPISISYSHRIFL